MEELRFRQIHLDFHTSEMIGDVAQNFDADKFADTLVRAHVNSITCFSKCHHGWLYYRSKRFPELVHPNLRTPDLLEQQIDACHKRGIKVPVYTTVQWDYHASHTRPDWICNDVNGAPVDNDENGGVLGVYDPGFYRTLCVNTSYRDYLKAQVADVFESLGKDRVDGFFFDIVNPVDCSCPVCVGKMKERGYDPTDADQRRRYSREMIAEFKRDMSSFVRSFKEDATIFYNAGHVGPTAYDADDAYTHYELESIPSGIWGYAHFLNTVRYARCMGKDILSHTGKFHTMWGDFHSFKNIEALKCETSRMLAYNCKCLIGDQLDPDGAISQPVYDLIGEAYADVERKEKWCSRAEALVDLAVLSPEAIIHDNGYKEHVPGCVEGATVMLDELGIQFDIIEPRFSFDRYSIIILPDEVTVDEYLKEKLDEFVSRGGRIIATGASGLDAGRSHFMLDWLGLEYIGERELYPDFIIPDDVIGKRLPKTEHVMYERGQEVRAVTAEPLLDTAVPYFNRTWEHFCSHRHTPSSGKPGSPAVYRNGSSIYFAHPIFTIYHEKHPRWCREIFRDALEMLLPSQLIRHDGPTTMVNTINQQKNERRYVLHLMHYIPVKNCRDLFTIEDVIPLYNITLRLSLPEKVSRAVLVPQCTEIPFRYEGDDLILEVSRIDGHQMVELDWE